MNEGGTLDIVLGAIGTSLGLLGTVLGSISTWRAMRLDRGILKVSVHRMFDPVSRRHHLRFEAVNIGRIPITVCSVGFTFAEKGKIYRFSPVEMDDKYPFPNLLQPGSLMSCIVPPLVFADPSWKLAKRPFFETADGKFVTGSRIKKQIIQCPLDWDLA